MKLTKQEKQRVRTLRGYGWGYRKIAQDTLEGRCADSFNEMEKLIKETENYVWVEQEGIKSKGLLERLAEIEHEQWIQWANAVKGEVSPERAKRWESYMKPYSELSEEAKDMDRVWANKVLVSIIWTYI